MKAIAKITGLKPVGKWVLLLPDDNSDVVKSSGGIILTETYDTVKRDIRGTVVAVSDKMKDYISVGDTIVYKKMHELSITIKDVRHVLLKEEHIVLVG